MPLGIPAYAIADGDLLQAAGGSFAPAGKVLTGAYTFIASQAINLGGSISGYSTVFSTAALQLYTDGVNSPRIAMHVATATAVGPAITGFKSRGNGTTPSATQLDDQLWQLGARLYGATAWSATNRAQIALSAAENCTDAAQGTYIMLALTPIGSATITNVFKGFGDASFQIGGTVATTTAGWGGGIAIGGIGTSGNGLLQLASGTTKANGVAWGTDTFLYRTAANVLATDGILTFDGATTKTIKYTNGTANGAVATTLGSVGPTGSTAGNPQGWLRVNIGGTDRYIPYW